MATLQIRSPLLVVLLLDLVSPVFCGPLVDTGCNYSHPIKCSFYNLCCGMDHFCHEAQRDCVSCFPEAIRTRQKMFEFCKEHQFEAASKMLHASCVGACIAMFGKETFFSLTCNATHPIGCPLYGKCCAMYSFCSETLKDCDSCFKDYDTDERQLQFCIKLFSEGTSKMRHPSCVGVCDAKFGKEKLFEALQTQWPTTTQTELAKEEPKPSSPAENVSTAEIVTYIAFVLSVIIAIIVVIFIIWWCKTKCSTQRKSKEDKTEMQLLIDQGKQIEDQIQQIEKQFPPIKAQIQQVDGQFQRMMNEIDGMKQEQRRNNGMDNEARGDQNIDQGKQIEDQIQQIEEQFPPIKAQIQQVEGQFQRMMNEIDEMKQEQRRNNGMDNEARGDQNLWGFCHEELKHNSSDFCDDGEICQIQQIKGQMEQVKGQIQQVEGQIQQVEGQIQQKMNEIEERKQEQRMNNGMDNENRGDQNGNNRIVKMHQPPPSTNGNQAIDGQPDGRCLSSRGMDSLS